MPECVSLFLSVLVEQVRFNLVSTGFDNKVIFTRLLGDLDNLVIHGYNDWVQNNQVGTSHHKK